MSSADQPRIAYILKMYPRLSETFIVTEVLAHEAAGLDIEIFSLRHPAVGRFEDLSRIKAPITYLDSSQIRASEFWRHIREASSELPRIWSALEYAGLENTIETHQAILLATILKERQFTHIHAHFGTSATSVARLTSRITDIPYSFTAHAKDIFHKDTDESAMRLKLRDASAVITVSEYNVSYLRNGYGDDACNVKRIYNGLDLAEFSYEDPIERKPLILGVGRLVEKKGFAPLIDACSILEKKGRSFDCQIIGDGLLRDELAKLIVARDLSHRVTLVGPRPRGDIIKAMRQSAMIAAPCVVGSDGNRDGLPTVLLEAMALGTPCISTDVTGIPEVIHHEQTGLVVEQNDSWALANEIDRLLDDPELRVRLARSARKLIEAEFNIHHNTQTMREILLHEYSEDTSVVKEAI